MSDYLAKESMSLNCCIGLQATAAMPRFDPDDSKAVFAHMSTKELYRAMALFELCTSPALMKAGVCVCVCT